jgi:hypothetical protein
MPTLAKLLQDSSESPIYHAPVATTPDEHAESLVEVDDGKHVQPAVAANRASLTSEHKAAVHCDIPQNTQSHWPDLKFEVTVKLSCPSKN